MDDLWERIRRDRVEAMKARDQERVEILRYLEAQLKNRSIELGGSLPGEEAEAVLQREAKRRREAIAGFAGRPGAEAFVEQQRRELAVIEGYLPAPLAPEELERMVEEAVAEAGASGPRDVGRVM
ncbi:MAG: GatB/YqeY domain-containing protein, partial [Clostridia bacterium]|nr:GatB/YqeY domain-containing protein [Clostridia bacterium]